VNVNVQRTPAKKKAHELAKYLRGEHPDYTYLKSVFRYLRTELEIQSLLRTFFSSVAGSVLTVSIGEAQKEYDGVMGKFPV
jgi:hypothetical protein